MRPTIDPEFKGLIRPQSEDEHALLRASIERDGCRDALVTWHGVLLDGHNRLEICEELGRKYETVDVRGVTTRDEALLWIIANQLARRNLEALDKAVLTEFRRVIVARQNEAQKVASRVTPGVQVPGRHSPIDRLDRAALVESKVTQNFVSPKDPPKPPRQDRTTSAILAKEVGVSAPTYEALVTVNTHGTPELKAAVRAGAVGASTAAKVAMLAPEVQRAAVVGGKGACGQAVRVAKRHDIAEAAKLPDALYRVVYADPPWQYSDSRVGVAESSAAEDHYPTMSVDDLCALPIKKLAMSDAVLFCWATFPLLPDALEVIRGWGFKYKTSFVWDKVRPNMGNYHGCQAELLLVCTRGSAVPEMSDREDQVQVVERTGRHSEKPEHFRQLIDRLYPSGKRIELFRRGAAPDGWEVWGNESV